jgi:hypothetical protein
MFNHYLFYLLIYPALLVLFIILGVQYAKRLLHRNKTWKPVGIENGLMGIYALLISFSLVIAGNHARERMITIHQEADELALLFRKSKFYEPALQQAVKNYMVGFYRIQLNNTNPSPRESMQLIDKVENLDAGLDEFLIRYTHANPQSGPEVNELISTIERLGDKYFLLLYSYGEQTPKLIIIILVVYSLMLGFLLGYMSRMQQNKVFVTIAVFVTISIIMINAVHDLDTPAKGIIRPNYQDLYNIKELIDSYYRP